MSDATLTPVIRLMEARMEPTVSQQDLIERTQQLIQDFLVHMGISATVAPRITAGEEGETVVFALRTKDANLLIGQGGANLLALQHVLRLHTRAAFSDVPDIDDFRFLIDVNNYRTERERYLRKLADEVVAQVRTTRREVCLRPMSSYERRVIHMHLSEEKDVTTESAGKGLDRYVVIRPLSAGEEAVAAVLPKSLVF